MAPPDSSSKRSFLWLLLLVTITGFVLRTWKLEHGLPYVIFSDEGHHVYWALNMGSGDLNPHQFWHPSLFFYVNFFADIFFILGGILAGFFKTPGDAWQLYRTDPTLFYILGRFVSAVFGTITIPLTYLATRQIADKRTSLTAALFLAFAFLHVQYSQIGYLDIMLAFFIFLSFLFSLKALQSGRPLFFVLGGFAAGLASSTKYNGAVSFLFGPLACLFWAIEKKASLKDVGLTLFLFFLFAGIGFTLGTPYWLLDFSEFKKYLLAFWGDYRVGGTGQLGYEGSWNWFYYLSNPLAYGLGLPLEIAGIAGILLLFLKKDWEASFVASFPLVYFCVCGFLSIRAARYMLPIFPFLCLSAAYFISHLSSWLAGKFQKIGAVSYAFFCFLILLPNLFQINYYLRLKSVPDTRNDAYRWIQENIPHGAKILQTFYAFMPDKNFWPVKDLDLTVFDTRLKHASSLQSLKDYRRQGFQYLIFDDWHEGIVLAGAAFNPKYKATGERYRFFLKELDSSAQLVATVSPWKQEGVFDLENVEFASRSLSKMKSLGPLIRIYKI